MLAIHKHDTEEDNGKQQDENNGGDADETGTHPSDQDTTMTNANAQEEGWLQIPRTYHPEANGDAADIRHIVCFGNNAFYFFFRLYQVNHGYQIFILAMTNPTFRHCILV
jgi:hypothetical protein